jgi:hypothetical protein
MQNITRLFYKIRKQENVSILYKEAKEDAKKDTQ